MSLSTLSSSQWRPMVPLVLAFVAFLVWGPGRVFRGFSPTCRSYAPCSPVWRWSPRSGHR